MDAKSPLDIELSTSLIRSRALSMLSSLNINNSRQQKANGAIDALSQSQQRSLDKEKVLQAQNTSIVYRLQPLPANASIAGLSLLLLCDSFTSRPPQLRQFWDALREEPSAKGIYRIRGMSLRLQDLCSEPFTRWPINSMGQTHSIDKSLSEWA